MADKEINFHLKTTGDPKGAKTVEKAIEQVDDAVIDLAKPRKLPLQADDIKPAAGSLSALTDEVRRLERELERVPVGGKAFAKLADELSVARNALGDAHAEARRLGGTVGRGGNAGMAVLEFSRAFEDAQYGIRGVLNNIPGLIAMLGGGAGLAGVVSIAAVAVSQLWERFGQSDSADETLDAIVEAAEKLVGRLKSVRNERREIEKMPTTDLARPLKEEETALKLQTQAFRDNIEAIKDRIAAAAALDAALTLGQLGNIDAAERGGELSSEQAAAQRDAVRKAAKERELARATELAKLDETVAEEVKEAARRELVLAEFRKNAAEQRLEAAKQEEEAVKAEQSRRAAINAARVGLEDAERRADGLGLTRDDATPERRDQLQRQSEQAADPGISARFGLAAKALGEIIEALNQIAELESGGAPRGLDAITKERERLNLELEKLTEAIASAEEEITSRTAELQLADQATSAASNRGREREIAGVEQRAADERVAAQQVVADAERKAAEDIGKLLDDILSSLGRGAQSPQVQEKAGTLRTLLENGLQRGEVDQSQALLQQLIGQMDAGDRQRGVLYQRILQTIERSVNAISIAAGRVTDLENRLRTVESSLRNAIPGN